MATITGLSEAQCAALAGISVGDLVFVQKVEVSRQEPRNEEDDESSDDEDYDGEADEGSDGDGSEESEGAENGDGTEDQDETSIQEEVSNLVEASNQNGTSTQDAMNTQDGSSAHDKASTQDVSSTQKATTRNTRDTMSNDDEEMSDYDEENSNSESPEESNDESGAEHSDSTDATETPIATPPRMFVVSELTKDDSGSITDAKLSLLTYSSKVGQQDGDHAYHIYGKEIVHHHPSTCGQKQECAVAVSIQEIATEESINFTAKPNGDIVRRLDASIWSGNQGRCVAGCNQGWLDRHDLLQGMIKDYDAPTLAYAAATGEPLPPSIQAAICPVCIGVDHLKDQQNLQGSLLQGHATFTDIIECHSRLNPRRRELGYRFQQLDEREWGRHFDDMVSEEDDSYEDDDGSRWQQWDEAQDPNSGAQTRPASAETIASLPRKTYKDAKIECKECRICTTEFEAETKIIELPCGHACFDEGCLETWLKQYDSCPMCRKTIPAASVGDGASITTAATDGGSTDVFEDAVTSVSDGEDVVMSDE